MFAGLESAQVFVNKQFDSANLIFDRQLDCTRPLEDQDRTFAAWGCGNGKQQVRKLCMYAPKKAPKRDIFLPNLWPYCNKSVLVITRQLRDALVAENLTGFVLTPVLDGNKNWAAHELEFSYRDEAQEAEAEWFQLTITARNKTPISLTQPLEDFKKFGAPPVISDACSICHVNSGRDNSAYPYFQQVHPLERFADADIQIWDQFQWQDNIFTADLAMSQLILSAKFVDLFVRKKFRGLMKLSPFSYQAMLVKEEIEKALGADALAGYPQG